MSPASKPKASRREAHSLARAKELVQRVVGERHDRPSLVSDIACAIGAEIIEGLLAPGADLNSVELSKRYQTSRTPVREALMLLEKEGMVDIPPRRRPRVMALSLPEIREIYRARAALFELIAEDVVRHVDEAGLTGLAAALQEMEGAYRKGDSSAFVWANLDFYDRSCQLSRNRTVKRMMDSLLLRTACLRKLSLSQPGRMASSFDDHTRLLRAYRERDALLAAALIRSNHMNALRALETHYRRQQDI
ncbi:GntR family transcriptional regulator [Aquabacter sp. CN5-332]|uniref:GntR family transcriptional regulator n=1 Tax=Aquabacter sp. CN5-332 TaxID=3156608 RepID=UPI0032B514FB